MKPNFEMWVETEFLNNVDNPEAQASGIKVLPVYPSTGGGTVSKRGEERIALRKSLLRTQYTVQVLSQEIIITVLAGKIRDSIRRK
jgi:hypothetical protein